jgi:hypothetical protein
MNDTIDVHDFVRSGKRDGYDFTVAADGRTLPGFVTSAAITQMVAQFDSTGTEKAESIRNAIAEIARAQLEGFPELESIEISTFVATN